jgi:hypothetical protein
MSKVRTIAPELFGRSRGRPSAAADTASTRKPEWQFRQEGLPFPSEAEAAEPWQPWRKNGTGTAWRRTLQQAVHNEASRCLNIIAHFDPDMSVEDMPAAVQDVAGHLFLLDRGYRWGVLHGLLDEFEEIPPVFWPLLIFWWCDAESNCIRGIVPQIKRAMKFDLGRMPHEFMPPEDKAFFESLPETVTIYRGIHRPPNRHIGISWTTDRQKAEWFAHRFASGEKKPVLLTGRVRKRKIIACFTDRNESEVLALPKHIRGRKEEELTPVTYEARPFHRGPTKATQERTSQ